MSQVFNLLDKNNALKLGERQETIFISQPMPIALSQDKQPKILKIAYNDKIDIDHIITGPAH